MKRRPDPPKPVSSEEALAFVRNLQERFLKPDRTPADDRRVHEYIKEFDPELLRSVAARVMIDVLKRPDQAGLERDLNPKPAAAAPPARKRKVLKRTAKAPSSRKKRRTAAG
jgi:hypothetical protein